MPKMDSPVKLNEALEKLHIFQHRRIFAEHWDRIMRKRPAGELFFLRKNFIVESCDYAGLADDMTQAAISTAKRIANDNILSSLSWYYHYRSAVEFCDGGEIRSWPSLWDSMTSEAGMFNVVILLSATPFVRKKHKSRGIPEDIVKKTLGDLEIAIDTGDYRKESGYWGISARILNWLTNHWRGKLYRLGRLQFIPTPFNGRLLVYRNRESDETIAMSEEGLRYTEEGYMDGAGGHYDSENVWTASLEVTGKSIIGNPISPSGQAMQKKIELPFAEWELVLAQGYPLLDMHIAAGEPMTWERCGESVETAMDFFPRYFPERPFRGFSCFSWILDPQFENLLPDDSNLVRFLREMYLFPIPGGRGSTMQAVFGANEDISPDELPRKTKMQRAFADHLANGGTFRPGGCFMLKEDFDWGSMFYRSRMNDLIRAEKKYI